jgi:signal transduction histidine kinase/DNA-binding response OmpR family regulator/ABC-type xylose transport system substrate-binding protein
MKNITYLLLLLLLAAACTPASRKLVIGVSQCSEDIWRDKQNNELKTGQYLYDNVELRFASARDNDQKQIEQINRFIDEPVDLLIVSPNQVNTISTVIDKAYARGIPVILFDRKTDSKNYTAFMGADNFEIGKTMGTLIANTLNGRGKVVEIMGLKGSSPAIERHRGFAEALQRYPGITLITSEQGDWTEQSGEQAMRKVLDEAPDVDVVFGQNDRLAMGARRAVQAELPGRAVRYFGVDGLPGKDGGIAAVKNGLMTATYIYPTHGTELMQLAMNILQRKPYRRENRLQSAIVTKNNADVLLMQYTELEKQSRNIDLLHRQVDTYFDRLNTQNTTIALAVALILILIFSAIMLYRTTLMKSRLNDELLHRNDELQQLSHEIEEMTQAQLTFFTNVSHELRTPLTLIADPVQRLAADSTITGERHELLSLASRNVGVLMQLVNDILDFRKVQNGKMSLRLSHFSLSEAITAWTRDFTAAAARHDITLTLLADPDTDYSITADRDKLMRVFGNLMSNALKYTPAGGKINITTGRTDDGQLRFSVSDTGMGIDADELPKVFERFFQTRHSTGGTGIGLALVKAFTELHHGQVTVQSEKGQGTAFTVTLPVTQQGALAEDEAAAASAPFATAPETETGAETAIVATPQDETEARETVLVIDDNADVRAYVRSVLGGKYTVTEADNGRAGLETARREVPDLVVCDVMMPVMDGLEFTNELKNDTATSHIPVVLLTARTLDDQRIEGYQQGADAYITKPFTAKVLMARVENLLRTRRNLRRLYASQSVAGTSQAPAYAASATADGPVGNSRDQAFIARLRQVIQQNMTDSDLSVEKIGSEIGLGRVQLYRKVKALTGSSPVELLRTARLQRARTLIQTTDKTISEIAYEVGFTAPSYFAKCFKDEFGMAPGEVRQE